METRPWWSTLTATVSLLAKMAPENHRNHQRWLCRQWSQINDAVQGRGSQDQMEDTSYKLSNVSRSITVLSYSSMMVKYHKGRQWFDLWMLQKAKYKAKQSSKAKTLKQSIYSHTRTQKDSDDWFSIESWGA